jgi:hypothetical protein
MVRPSLCPRRSRLEIRRSWLGNGSRQIKLSGVTLDRWWIPAAELRTMQYLGWYRRPDGKRQRAPWIVDSGELDAEQLIGSELFEGHDVEPVVDVVAVPSAISDMSALAADLNARRWSWPPENPETFATPAWAARTASNAFFRLNRDGLLVHFGCYPTWEPGSDHWTGSPLWAAFLLVCVHSTGNGYPPFPPDQPELWTRPLEFLSEQRPWLSDDAHDTSKSLTWHFTAVRKQAILKGRRGKPLVIRKR